MATFRNLPKNLGPEMNMFLEKHALFGDCLFKVFHWRCIKRCQLDQVIFTTSVIYKAFELEYHILLHMCMHNNYSRDTNL